MMNIVSFILLFLFLITVIITLMQEKENVYGVIVKNKEGNVLLNGKQGVETVFGRYRQSDISLESRAISRLMKPIKFTGEIEKPTLRLGNDIFFLEKPDHLFTVRFKALPVLMSGVFLVYRYFSLKSDFPEATYLPLIFAVLLAYLVSAYLLAVNSAPVIESSFVILLSYYTYASLYKADNLKAESLKCLLGVILYIGSSLAVRLFVTYMPFDKEATFLSPKWLKRIAPFINSSTPTCHDVLRIGAAIAILALIGLNLVLGLHHQINGAANWVRIGTLQFQPSEFIKPLLFVMLLPSGKRFFDKGNLVFLFAIPAIVALYAVAIKDIGFLVLISVVFILCVILNADNLLLSALLFSCVCFSVKLIMKISATAASRLSTWKGRSLLEAIGGGSLFSDVKDKTYQQANAFAGIINGGAFGIQYQDLDVLQKVPYTDSDLVSSTICQRYGITAYLLLFLVVILLFTAALINIRKQTKLQMSATLMSALLLTTAFVLNIGATFGVVPFSGLVCPFLSKGLSAAVAYGACVGFMTSTSRYTKNIYSKSPHKFMSDKELIDALLLKKEIRHIRSKWETLKAGLDALHQKHIYPGRIAIGSILAATVLLGGIMLREANDIFASVQYREKAEHLVAADTLKGDSQIKNILLLGVDARKGDDNETSRADTMLLISVDTKHHCIKMTSFLRDMWVYIPSKEGYQRLNAATTYGGYPSIVDTIEYNFGVAIDGYAVINFELFRALINAIGGVELNITGKEVVELTTHPERYGKLDIQAGKQVCDGNTALAYARIRKIDTDFMRTKRQRNVLNSIINKIKAKPLQMFRAAKEVAGYIETDLNDKELFGIASKAILCLKKIEQERVPFDNTWRYETKNGASIIAIDDNENKELLVKYIYE